MLSKSRIEELVSESKRLLNEIKELNKKSNNKSNESFFTKTKDKKNKAFSNANNVLKM